MARTKEFDEEAVLKKAIKLFWWKGYNGTSAQDLVDELGISRSSLYDTYGDKRALFIKSLQQYQLENAGDLLKLIEESTNIESTIKKILQTAVQESLDDKTGHGCFMVNAAVEIAPQDSEIAAIIRQNMQLVEDALQKAVKKGQDAGIFSSEQSSRALARFLFNTLTGIRVCTKTSGDKKMYDDIVKVTMAALK